MLSSSVVEAEKFGAPNFTGPLQITDYLAHMPQEVTCKGLFFHDIYRLLADTRDHDAAKRLTSKRYIAFKDYPLREHMELTAAATCLLFPGVDGREAMRRLGWLAFPAFADSLIGRVIFGIFGNDLDRIFSVGPKSFSVSLSRGGATAERIGERHWRYRFKDIFGYLDTYYLGVLEGPIRHLGFVPELQLQLDSLSSGTVDIRWS